MAHTSLKHLKLEHRHAARLEAYKTIYQFASIGMRGLILTNAGAVLAMLTFVGNLFASDNAENRSIAILLVPSFGWFVAGVILSLLVSLFSYAAQMKFVYSADAQGKSASGSKFIKAAVASALLSGVALIIGSYKAYNAFTLSATSLS
jgi:hypothetical protein